jgi:hypothetical protein
MLWCSPSKCPDIDSRGLKGKIYLYFHQFNRFTIVPEYGVTKDVLHDIQISLLFWKHSLTVLISCLPVAVAVRSKA